MDPLSPGGAEERAEARALLLLQSIDGLADRGIAALRDAFGSGRAALAAPRAEFDGALGRGGLAARRDAPRDRALVDELLARADALGVRVVPIGSAAYPSRLLHLSDPPPVLFLRGDAALLEKPSVAVVGSRRASGYGRRIAARLGEALGGAGVVVVSGLALGVDGEAHRGALAARGGTIAVLGSGPDTAHPPSHARLFGDIVAHGLIVSEFGPGTPPLAHHFPRRNRIMAALADVVVVVEAAERSGALITVEHAAELGRDVLAVPGPIDARTSAGTNRLIRDGARPVFHVDDVLAALALPVPLRAPTAPTGVDETAVWEALDGAPAPVEEVAARSGLSAARALTALAVLQIDGWAVESAGHRFARRP